MWAPARGKGRSYRRRSRWRFRNEKGIEVRDDVGFFQAEHEPRVGRRRAVIAKLVEMAKASDLAAIRELFDRTVGKPVAGVEVDQPAPIRLTEAKRRQLIEKIVREAHHAELFDAPGGDGEWKTPVRLAARLVVVGLDDGLWRGDGVP